jgi:16S rRNA (cytosine967-C5)-methyltransferase
MDKDHTRIRAVKSLVNVEKSAYSNIALDKALSKSDNINHRFATRLVYGTLEKRNFLDYMTQKFLNRPISKLDITVLCILRVGAYQLKFMDSVPRYAAVNSSVRLCESFKNLRAKSLVNAVLRKIENYDIDSADFSCEIERVCTVYSVSSQIAKIIMSDYPNEYEEIFTAMSKTPQINIVINTVKISVNEYLRLLGESGIKYLKTEITNIVKIYKSGDIRYLPGFDEGFFYVQGFPSFFAVSALAICPGDRVLDLCAAPGGKSFACEILSDGKANVISCDSNADRLDALRESAIRLGFKNIKTFLNDGSVYNEKFSNQDIVICDVPCSGLGTIAKKPDIRYKNLDKIKDLIDLQYKILSTGSKYLKPGGKLLYSTCTINKSENRQIVEKFLKNNREFELIKINGIPKSGTEEDKTITFLPKGEETDGFFLAIIKKIC